MNEVKWGLSPASRSHLVDSDMSSVHEMSGSNVNQ